MARRYPVAVRILPGCRGRTTAAELRRAARAVMEAEAVAPGVGLEVVLADGGTVQELNRLYRDRDEATDVLSFASRDVEEAFVEAPGLEASLGEVVICLPVAEAQARGGGRPVKGEIAHLLVHGVLHLVGYDHESEADATRMKAREDEVLAGLGLEGAYAHGH